MQLLLPIRLKLHYWPPLLVYLPVAMRTLRLSPQQPPGLRFHAASGPLQFLFFFSFRLHSWLLSSSSHSSSASSQ